MSDRNLVATLKIMRQNGASNLAMRCAVNQARRVYGLTNQERKRIADILDRGRSMVAGRPFKRSVASHV